MVVPPIVVITILPKDTFVKGMFIILSTAANRKAHGKACVHADPLW